MIRCECKRPGSSIVRFFIKIEYKGIPIQKMRLMYNKQTLGTIFKPKNKFHHEKTSDVHGDFCLLGDIQFSNKGFTKILKKYKQHYWNHYV